MSPLPAGEGGGLFQEGGVGSWYCSRWLKTFPPSPTHGEAGLTCFELACEAQQLGVGREKALVQFAKHQHLRPPVLGVQGCLLQAEEGVAGCLQTQPRHTITPLLLSTEREGERKVSPSPPSTPPPTVRSMRKVAPPSSAPTDSPSVLNVLVDHHGDDEGGQGVVPGHDEHDHQAEHGPQEGGGPVVVAEARTPARGLQDGLNERGQVYKHVAHEEEPGGGCVCVLGGMNNTNICLGMCTLQPGSVPLPLSPPIPAHAHMVRIGATRSRLAMITPTSAIRKVRMRAKLGSPFRPVRLKKLRNGMRLSLAMA